MVVIVSATGQRAARWMGTQQAQNNHVALLKQATIVDMSKREESGEKGGNYRSTRLHILAERTVWRLQRVF